MKKMNNSSGILKNLLILLVIAASVAAAIYLFRDKLKALPGLNRLTGNDDDAEFDVFDDLDDFDLAEEGPEAEAEGPEKAEKTDDKVRRGYVRLKFNKAEEA